MKELISKTSKIVCIFISAYISAASIYYFVIKIRSFGIYKQLYFLKEAMDCVKYTRLSNRHKNKNRLLQYLQI